VYQPPQLVSLEPPVRTDMPRKFLVQIVLNTFAIASTVYFWFNKPFRELGAWYVKKIFCNKFYIALMLSCPAPSAFGAAPGTYPEMWKFCSPVRVSDADATSCTSIWKCTPTAADDGAAEPSVFGKHAILSTARQCETGDRPDISTYDGTS